MKPTTLATVGLLFATMSLGEQLFGGAVDEIGAASQTPPAQAPAQTPATRRSQRIRVPEIRVSSPNGRVTFTLLSNAERLTFTVALDGVPVLEPSPIALNLDGYELSTRESFSKTKSATRARRPIRGSVRGVRPSVPSTARDCRSPTP